MEEERPTRIEDLIGRALYLGAFRMCMPIDIFETGILLAEHEQFEEALGLAPDFAASQNHFSRFCFAYALQRRVENGGGAEILASAARLFEDDPDPHARKHARETLKLIGGI